MMEKPVRRMLTGLVLGSVVVLISGAAPGQSRFDAELQNLRALPFGYTSWCEAGNLFFKSPSSARFRIANAALCIGKPDGYIICSATPAPPAKPGATPVPTCADITALGA